MLTYEQLTKIPMERNYNLPNIGAILQNYKLTMPAIGATPNITIYIPESMEVEKKEPLKIGDKSEKREEVKRSESFLFPEAPKTPITQSIISNPLPSPILPPQESFKPIGKFM